MRAVLTGFQVQKSSPVGEIHQALRAVDTAGRPHLLGYTAVARMNPFQSLLYHSFGERGVAVAPILKGHDFRVVGGFRSLSASQTIHFHWLSWVLARATSADDASRKVDGLLGRVSRFSQKGGRIVWSVHNVYPHDAQFVEQELRLQQGIADLADVVHVMAEATTTAMDGLLQVDAAKLVRAPHPNYVGAYEDHVSRTDARAALGIDADETVFVLFGALKEYKGLHEALDGFRAWCDRHPDRRGRLLVAGNADDTPGVRQFVDLCLADPRVLIDPRRIAADKTQYYMRAADVGLVTYTRSLNSGAALLYLSFGLHVLATDTPVFREVLPAGTVTHLADPGTCGVEAYAAAMDRAVLDAGASSPDSVLASIADLGSQRVSAAFHSDLAPHLGW